MSAPLVSVIIPVYNSAAFLAEALESVARQAYAPLEIIVVDDGSSDGSARLAQQAAQARGLALQVVRQENRGPSAARNHGLRLAGGELLAFLDADDVWQDYKLVTQQACLAAHPLALFAWGRTRIFTRQDGQYTRLDKAQYMPNMGSLLFRRAAFERVGFFDESLRHGEDLDWLMRAHESSLPHRAHPEVVLGYRQHGGNVWLGQPNPERASLAALKKSLDRRRAGGG